VAKRDWELIRELTSAIGRSNTPRAFVRAVGEALHGWDARAVKVDLDRGDHRDRYEASLAKSAWTVHQSRVRGRGRSVEAGLTPRRQGVELALPIAGDRARGEFRARFGNSGHPILSDATYLSTLARLVAVAVDRQDLIARVADLSRRAHLEARELRETLDRTGGGDLVARSPAMRLVVDRIEMVARFETSVLISGESGVGKELVSRRIHELSPRARRPFLQVNCGAIPEQLVESELFGHERGAFTGAERAHRGLFEQADGGILLLDEVAELPLLSQAKLLRVLQEGRVRRVGAESESAVDVRVLAATNRALDQMVASGEFRQDLYYRLNVFPIDVPPLRDRLEDLAPLVRALLERLARKLNIATPAVSRSALQTLAAHGWPGNVRELANVLEAALIAGGGHSLVLPPAFGARLQNPPRVGSAVTLETSIRQAIERALRTSRGKIYGPGGAADTLGLNPATLQSKMRKLGIRRAHFVN